MLKTVLGYRLNILKPDHNLASQIVNIFGINPILADIISKINNITLDNIENFISPKLKNLLPNPYIIHDMEKAVNCLISAIENKHKIGILGDYDVDGVSSSVILKTFLELIGVSAEVIVPDRFKDGYGPSIPLFDRMHKLGVNLIITLDCGTVAFEPIEYANSLGIQVIVVDHHISDIKKSDAVAVINPNQTADTSGLNYLCAAGVTFLFCIAVNTKLTEINKIEKVNLLYLLPFVMLGTICDMMKMIELNRAFYHTGIEILNKVINKPKTIEKRYEGIFIGIKAMMQVAGLVKLRSTYDMGFILGPMINAGGRIDSAMIGIDLLTSKDFNSAIELAKTLQNLNLERRNIQSDIVDKAIISAEKLIQNDKSLIFVKSNDWHEGVIGIVASKIKEIYNKPVIIGSISNQSGIEIIKASCRSIDGVDIGNVVMKAINAGLLLKGGGHAGAAGFSCLASNYEKLYDFLESELKDSVLNAEENKSINISAEILPSQINKDFCHQLSKLEPFGIGNIKPVFLIRNIIPVKFQILKEKHYKILFRSNQKYNEKYEWIDVIFFNATGTKIANVLNNLINTEVNLICNIESSDYGNGVSVILIDVLL